MLDTTNVLLVDDDARLLNAARRVLRKHITLETAQDAEAALACLHENGPFAVVISDQNMPDMKGADLLAIVARRWPTTVRMMLTGNNDQATAISAVNDGQVFRFINKPCGPEDLLEAISMAAKHYALLMSEKTLLEQTLSGSVKVLTDVLALSRPEAFKRSSDIQRWAKHVSTEMTLERPWELDLAAMLCTLGDVAVPDSITRKYYAGAALNDNERSLLDHASVHGRDLIANVPRMRGIADAIYYCRKGFDGSGVPEKGVKGEAIPPIGRLLKILLDLAEATTAPGTSFQDGIAQLNRNAAQYDPDMLTSVAANLAADEAFTLRSGRERIQVSANGLREGDITAVDILDDQGNRLLVSGSTLTALTIKRLRSMEKLNQLAGAIDIWRAQAAD